MDTNDRPEGLMPEPGWTSTTLRAALAEARLNLAADDLVEMVGEREMIARLALDLLDRAESERARLRRQRDDAAGGYHAAAEYLDRFRDVVCEVLGHSDRNPGDDDLIRQLRAHFGKNGPEPTRWRDFCTGALAGVDQINARRRDDAASSDEVS